MFSNRNANDRGEPAAGKERPSAKSSSREPRSETAVESAVKGTVSRASQAVDEMHDTVDVRSAQVFILIAVGILAIIGVVMVFSVTSTALSSDRLDPFSDVLQQLSYIGIGVLFMLAIWFLVPVRSWLGPLLWGYYIFCIVLLILTFAIGTSVNGAKRWLFIGPIGFQPSEFVKIGIVLMMIRILYDKRTEKIRMQVAAIMFLVLICAPLIFIYFTQSDLGSVAICAVGILAVLWVGGVSRPLLGAILAVGIIAVVIAIFGVGYRSSRLVFLNPWDDGEGGLGDGYNIIHSYYAISQGGLFGMGIGASHEKYDYLFAADSDFIFAIICEELGFVGAMVVIGLFLVILFASFRIANACPDSFGSMVAASLAIMLVFQAFLNIGCTIGVFPTTGKPLPFISSGGSSVITSLAIIGLIMSVARDSYSDARYRQNRDNLTVLRGGRR